MFFLLQPCIARVRTLSSSTSVILIGGLPMGFGALCWIDSSPLSLCGGGVGCFALLDAGFFAGAFFLAAGLLVAGAFFRVAISHAYMMMVNV